MFDDPCIAEAMRTYVLGSAPVVALRLDANRCIVGANVQARQMLGNDVVGRLLSEQIVDFYHILDLGSLLQQRNGVHRLTLCTASGLPETLYFQFISLPDGTLALGSLDFTDEQRLRDEVLGMNRELNNLTRQLHQANADLRELNELKNRFIGMAAHDLRKPIGLIMTYSEFVLDEAGDRLDDEQKGFLRTSLAAAIGMKRLIDNFLDVSIIESGHLQLEKTRTNVIEILAGVLPMVNLVAVRKKVELVAQMSDGAHPLVVDVAKLQQLLVNLLSNAIEHSQASQTVLLAVSWKEDQVVFSVSDQGAGIALDDQKRLFAPFAHAGTRKTAGERSVGLGLAIARLVAQAHGGRIWVDSEPGAGAAFYVSLPTGV